MFAEAGAPPVEISDGTAAGFCSFESGIPALESTLENIENEQRRPPPPVFSADPDLELEERLERDPCNLDAKVDVGSDESMDASDPPSVVRPGNNEPVPSSSSPGASDGNDDDEDDSAA